MNPDNTPGMLIIDGTRCPSCIHNNVCHYRIEGRTPGQVRKKVEAFGTIFTKVRCEHFRAD